MLNLYGRLSATDEHGIVPCEGNMKITNLLGASALAIATLTGAGAASAAIFQNGSFETGTFTADVNNVSSEVVGSTNITGWTVYSDTVAWIQDPNPFSLTASPGGGSHFLDLTGYHDNSSYAGVKQTFDTKIGGVYNVSFDLGNSSQYGGLAAATVSAAGKTFAFFTNTVELNNWKPELFTFTANSNATTLAFVGTAGGAYIGLDNVGVQLIGAAVPEPTSWAMLLVGFAGLGGVLRRRRAAMAPA